MKIGVSWKFLCPVAYLKYIVVNFPISDACAALARFLAFFMSTFYRFDIAEDIEIVCCSCKCFSGGR